MKHEPRGLLRHLQVLCECGRRDALRVVRDEPDRHEPLAQRQLGIFEDRSNLNRKSLAAFCALKRPLVRKMKYPSASAVRAKLAITPPDRAEMVDASLFVGERIHQFEQAVERFKHSEPSRCMNTSTA